MLQKKICMLGSFAVGKTCLVRQYVESIFSEKYQTTVGVKIDKKVITVGHTDIMMMLWDMAGDDDFYKISPSHLRGASGFIYVVDGTRRETLDKAIELKEEIEKYMGELPFTLVLNKTDLIDEWELDDTHVNALISKGWNVVRASAKTGESVNSIFTKLAETMLGLDNKQVC